MSFSLGDKITLLNQTTLDSFNEQDRAKIAANFTKTGLKVLQADFGFVWFKSIRGKSYELVYKSPNTPYQPLPPREGGKNQGVYRTKSPIFVTKAKKLSGKYDITPYLKSFVIIPVIYQKHQYGNVVLCFETPRSFSQEDESLCIALGNAMAQAMTINRLYSNLSEFKKTLDNTLDSIFIFNPSTTRIEYANNGSVLLTGKKRKEIMGKDLSSIITGLSKKELLDRMDEIREHDNLQYLVFDCTIKQSQGKNVPVEISLQHVEQSGQPERFLAIVRDISDRKRAEETIRKMAYFDSLTGLPNRILFNNRLREEYERAGKGKGRFCVFFIDLDRFKVINDIYGHHVGDELLKAVAGRIQKAIPKKATLCRMGGDEFMVLLPQLSEVKESVKVAKAIQEQFVEYFQMSDQEVYVNCSVGLAIYPYDGEDMRTVLKHADLALHRAKEQGGNNYQQYNKGLRLFYSMQPKMEKQLRQALKQNELVMHYQPIMSLKSNKMIYSEALVRWNHPEMGLLYPEAFITQAEESGLIVEMGEWVLREVAGQIQQWRKEGRKILPVSINISPRQLLRPSFLKSIEDVMSEYKIKKNDIILELTETFLMKNIDMSVGMLEQIKQLGLQIVIDDFGTGYASLNYLKRLPIDGVKIDRSFVMGSTENLQDAGLTAAIISIAHQLNLTVVAEGVENKQQLALLREHHCDSAQGNYFHRPLPSKDFAKLLHKK